MYIVFGTYGMIHSVLSLLAAYADSQTGSFFLSFAATLTPYFNAASAYEPSNPANPGFHTAFGK